MSSPSEKVHVRVDKDKTGKVEYGIRHAQNVSPTLSEAEKFRRREREHGFKKGSELRRVASLPMTVVMDVREKYGIDVFNLRGDDGKRLLKIIDTEYPKLKTTEMQFSRRKVI